MIGPTQSVLPPPSARFPPVIVGTKLTSEQTKALSAAAQRIGGRVVKEFDPALTSHVVTGTVPGQPRVCRRTYKYLLGVAQGCWVVSAGWAEQCMRLRSKADETMFEIVSDGCGKGAPRASREAALAGKPRLFEGMRFWMHGSFSKMSSNELKDLIVLLGGGFAKREPHAGLSECECNHMVEVVPGFDSGSRRRTRRSGGAVANAASLKAASSAAAAALAAAMKRTGGSAAAAEPESVDTAVCVNCGATHRVPAVHVEGAGRVYRDVIVLTEGEHVRSRARAEDLARRTGRVVVDKGWVLECLSNYKLAPFEPHELLAPQPTLAFKTLSAKAEASKGGMGSDGSVELPPSGSGVGAGAGASAGARARGMGTTGRGRRGSRGQRGSAAVA